MALLSQIDLHAEYHKMGWGYGGAQLWLWPKIDGYMPEIDGYMAQIDGYIPKLLDTCPKLIDTCPTILGTISEEVSPAKPALHRH